MRIIEILVGVNALCGIAAFLIARGAIRRGRDKAERLLGLDEEERKRTDVRDEVHGPY